MSEVVPLIAAGIVGALVGGAVGWLWAAGRRRRQDAVRLQELEHRAAAQEGSATAVREELQRSREAVDRLQDDLRTATAQKADAEARIGEMRAGLEEQRRLLEDAKARLSEAFRALAADALKSSNEDFLRLAEQRFKTLAQEATGELEARKTAVETLVEPLQQVLAAYQKEARELEEKRLREISGVGRQLAEVAQAQTALQRETSNLVHALRAPQVRGRWGEIALRKTAELAGMTKHCDFSEQETVQTEGGRLRPDMIVHLPAKRDIVVDAKVALHAYLDALEASGPEQREAALARHAQQVRMHVRRLASKEYWSQFPQAPDFVVLFIPGEAFFAAAAERDPDLLQDALASQVLIATPTTFVGLLLTAAYGWRQEQVAENAQRIGDLGRQVHERLTILVEHVAWIGKSLEKSVEAYNKAVGSLETRVLPAARRFAELDAGAGKPIPGLEPIVQTPRVPTARDGAGGVGAAADAPAGGRLDAAEAR
jgi:DNA recombination protein RmuC